MTKQRGKVNGDTLTVKATAREFYARLTESHIPWRNCIASVMA